MFCLWNLCFVFSIVLPLSPDALAQEVGKDIPPGSDRFGPDTVDLRSLPLSWPSSSSEQLDRQGVIGEYDGLLESTEATVFSHGDKELVSSKPTSSSKEEATGDGTTTEHHAASYESTDLKSGSFLDSFQTQSPDQVFTGESREQTSPALAPGHWGQTTEPPLNSQRQDMLGQTTNTGRTLNTEAFSKLEDTGEGLTTLSD